MSLADLFKTQPQPEIISNSYQEHPPEVPLVPAFETVTINYVDGRSFEVNPAMFASLDTASAIAARFGGTIIVEPVSPVPGGWDYRFQDGSPAFRRILVLSPGAIIKAGDGSIAGTLTAELAVNAGQLADYFRRMPEAEFPASSYVSLDQKTGALRRFFALPLAEQQAWDLLRRAAENAGIFKAAA